ncbi:MAG: hypothetical protein ACLUKN_03125 [Bacilli bacterium]
MKYIAAIINKLDIDADPLTKSEVFYIKHGEAKDVASVLNQIVKGQQSAVKAAQTAKTNAAAQANRTNLDNKRPKRKPQQRHKASDKPNRRPKAAPPCNLANT